MTASQRTEPTCAWCGQPATRTITLEPARMGVIKHPMHGPQRCVVKKAITADACAACAIKATLTPGVQQRDPRNVPAGRGGQLTIDDMLGT